MSIALPTNGRRPIRKERAGYQRGLAMRAGFPTLRAARGMPIEYIEVLRAARRMYAPVDGGYICYHTQEAHAGFTSFPKPGDIVTLVRFARVQMREIAGEPLIEVDGTGVTNFAVQSVVLDPGFAMAKIVLRRM
jgi:hypothetical protein